MCSGRAYLTVEALELPFRSRRTAAVTRCKRALPWLIAAVLVTIINPWGIRIFAAISRQQSVVHWQSASLEEWEPVQAASALQELGWRTPDSARWWLLGLGIILAALCLWRRRIGPALVLLLAAFAFLRHQRMEGPCIILICLIGGSVLAKRCRSQPISPAQSELRFRTCRAACGFRCRSLLRLGHQSNLSLFRGCHPLRHRSILVATGKGYQLPAARSSAC